MVQWLGLTSLIPGIGFHPWLGNCTHSVPKKKKKKKAGLGETTAAKLLFLLLKTILFMTPRTAAHQASLSSTIFWSLHKLMSIEPVMPSNRLILCHHPLLLLLCLAFMSQLFTSGGQKIGASASALPVADELEKNSSPQVTLTRVSPISSVSSRNWNGGRCKPTGSPFGVITVQRKTLPTFALLVLRS